MLPRFHLLVFLASFALFSGFRFQPGCSRFKNGTFYCYLKTPGGWQELVIIRKGDKQTEIIPASHDTTWQRVRWTRPCHYELQLIRSTLQLRPDIQRMRESIPVDVQITGNGRSSKSAYYLFSVSRQDIDFVFKDTAWLRPVRGR